MSPHQWPSRMLEGGVFRQFDPGDGGRITITGHGNVVALKSGSSNETRTLADPIAVGQIGTIHAPGFGGGNIVITSDSPVKSDGSNTITIGDTAGYLVLIALNTATTPEWRPLKNQGVTLS